MLRPVQFSIFLSDLEEAMLSCLQMMPNWDQYTQGQGYHTSKYRHPAGMGQQELYEIQQGQTPDPAMDQTLGRSEAGDCLAGEQRCRKGSGGGMSSKLDMKPQCVLAAKRASYILSV